MAEITKRPASTTVTLDECISRAGDIPAGESFYENYGSCYFGEIDGADIMVLDCMFNLGGQKIYRIPKGDSAPVLMMTYIVVPHDGNPGMHANEFYGNWVDPNCAVPMEVIQEPDKVIWQLDQRQFVSRPPYWDVKGENHGVIADVTLGGLGPVHRPYEPWSKFKETRMGGYWVPCWAEGTITVGGKTHTLKNGFGFHNYIIHGNNWDTFDMVRNSPYYWIWGINSSVQFFVFNLEGETLADYADGYLWHDGEEVKYPPQQIQLTELETWIDPRSGMSWPCKWHINMNSDKGVLDVMVVGRGSGQFCQMTRAGVEIHYGIFARANGHFFKPDGTSVAIENMIMYVERGRVLMSYEKAK